MLVLATGGMRTIEACAIRNKDIKLIAEAVSADKGPTLIHIRPECAKTRVGRDIYISQEANKYLKEWIDFRYRDRDRKDAPIFTKDDDDLIFQQVNTKDVTPGNNYRSLVKDFNDVLKTLKMDSRKEGMMRRKVTLQSFRRFVKTVISTQTNSDYSEWFLGHTGSRYWQMKEEERREIYATKCMKYLTFLDYSLLEKSAKNIDERLHEKDVEMANLRQKDIEREDIIQSLVKAVNKLRADKDKSEKKMKAVTKKLEEIERQEKEAEDAYESAMARLDTMRGK